MGLNSIGPQTMRKTFAWRYYKATNDIYYLQNLLNHASPSITYRYIGEKPNVEVVLKKMTPAEKGRHEMQTQKMRSRYQPPASHFSLLCSIHPQ